MGMSARSQIKCRKSSPHVSSLLLRFHRGHCDVPMNDEEDALLTCNSLPPPVPLLLMFLQHLFHSYLIYPHLSQRTSYSVIIRGNNEDFPLCWEGIVPRNVEKKID